VDARSDIYSLGATYYSLLTARNPYEDSGSVVQVMFSHCNASPPDPREVGSNVPPACANIIERSMALRPEDRYQTADEMRADLEAILAAMSGDGISLPSESSADLPQPTNRQSPRMSRRVLIGMLIAGVLCAVVGFLKFSGSFDDEDSNGQSIVTPASGDVIKVGVLHSLTGTMAASESPVVEATLLAIDEINQQGGLLGRPVEAVVADGKSDSNVFASEAARLIEDEAVCIVFGCWTSASRKTVVPVFEELDHLLVYPVQYEGIEESPNVIYTGAAPNQQIIPAVKWAFAFENKRRFFLVGSDYVFPRVAHEIIKDQLKELGAELAGEEFVPLGSLDVKAVVDKIIAVKPDVILNCINGGTNTQFFKELRSGGVMPQSVPTISFSIGEAELQQLDVSAMTGDYAAWNYFQTIDSEQNSAFVTAFRGKYGEDRVVTDPMEAAYFGVKLWAQAVESGGTADVVSIRRAMRNQRLQAPGGQVRIDPATQHTFKTPRIGRVKSDGQFEIVWTSVNPEPPNPYPSTRTTEQWKALLHDLYTAWGGKWSATSN
jgi:urea transport system substrate-binding protein